MSRQFSGFGGLPQVQRVARAAFDWSSDLDERPTPVTSVNAR
jgi:hypothetical protein